MIKKTLFEYRNNRLFFDGINLEKISQKAGTPCYVYSSDRILKKYNELNSAFQGNINIHYSMKANSHRGVLKLLRQAGSNVDVVSGGEIKRALDCGFKGQQIIFSGVAKTEDEITLALRNNILLFNVESRPELERISLIAKKLKKSAPISLRINPDVNPVTHPYITTGYRENKFGIDSKELPQIVRLIKSKLKNLNLLGLDFHIGSQLTKANPLYEAAKSTVKLYSDLQSHGFSLQYFDIGGGIGISYQGEETIDVNKYGQSIQKLLSGLDCQLLCEPGRYLVGDAGVLVTKVEYIKQTRYRNFIIVDTGIHHMIRPALYDAYHHILPVKKNTTASKKWDVVGPICESSDFLAKNRNLPQPQQGDLLAVCDTGAYGYVMVSDYNLRDRPSEILV